MINPAQCRAARSMLEWNQPQLAAAAGVSPSTLRDFESGKRTPISNNLTAIQNALESAGIKFIEDGQTSAAGGPGVRLFKSDNQFDTDVTQTVQYPEHLQPDAPTGAGG